MVTHIDHGDGPVNVGGYGGACVCVCVCVCDGGEVFLEVVGGVMEHSGCWRNGCVCVWPVPVGGLLVIG